MDDSGYDSANTYLYESTDRISGRLYLPTVGDCLFNADENDQISSHFPSTDLGGMCTRTNDKITLGVMIKIDIKNVSFYTNIFDDTGEEPCQSQCMPEIRLKLKYTLFQTILFHSKRILSLLIPLKTTSTILHFSVDLIGASFLFKYLTTVLVTQTGKFLCTR